MKKHFRPIRKWAWHYVSPITWSLIAFLGGVFVTLIIRALIRLF